MSKFQQWETYFYWNSLSWSVIYETNFFACMKFLSNLNMERFKSHASNNLKKHFSLHLSRLHVRILLKGYTLYEWTIQKHELCQTELLDACLFPFHRTQVFVLLALNANIWIFNYFFSFFVLCLIERLSILGKSYVEEHNMHFLHFHSYVLHVLSSNLLWWCKLL